MLYEVITARLLTRVHLDVVRDGDVFHVTPPPYRFDIEIEVDLVEELVRLHGYDNIPTPAPQGSLAMLDRPEDRRDAWHVRRLVADRDFLEVVNYAFIEDGLEADFCGNASPIRLRITSYNVCYTKLLRRCRSCVAPPTRRQA